MALATVYRRHGAAITLCLPACAIAGSGSGRDLETFLWLATGATGFDATRSSLAAFLYGVARNHALRIRAAAALRRTADDSAATGAAQDTDVDAVSDALAHLLARERSRGTAGRAGHIGCRAPRSGGADRIRRVLLRRRGRHHRLPGRHRPFRLNRAKEALRQRIVELSPADTRISA